jgi:hypothetical protein
MPRGYIIARANVTNPAAWAEYAAKAGGAHGLTASKEMLFTPNFLLAPRALSEMN